MNNVVEKITRNEIEYVISKDKKNRYFVHRLGDLIPSIIPSEPAGPERKAYCLNPIGHYKNKYQYGTYSKGYKTLSIAIDAIKQ